MFWSQLWSTNKTRNMPSVESGVMRVQDRTPRLDFNFVLHTVYLGWTQKPPQLTGFFILWKVNCWLPQHVFSLFA